jgi:hypothetical protein
MVPLKVYIAIYLLSKVTKLLPEFWKILYMYKKKCMEEICLSEWRMHELFAKGLKLYLK